MFTLAFLSLISTAAVSKVLYTLDNVVATVYYDLTETATNDICASTNGGPFTTGWADATINMGITECQNLMSNKLQSLADLGTNRIVAIDHNLIASDPAYWCGRELVLYDASGAAIEFSEGSFIVWDGCVAAETKNIVDLSALAFVEIKGGTCSGNNPSGLRYEIMDNYIWTPLGASSGSTPSSTLPSSSSRTTSSSQRTSSALSSVTLTTTTLTSSSASATTQSNAKLIALTPPTASSPSISPSSTKSVSSSSVVVSPAPSSSALTTGSEVSLGCTYGAWQCDGLEIQVCSYIDLKTLAWETVGQCGNLCAITVSGSVDCE